MKNFEIEEFDSPDKKGSGKYMDAIFLGKIDEARDIANIPFKITSGYRTRKRNKKVGGVANSSHLKGLAADIRCKDSKSRCIILNALLEVGFNRIGIAKTFIHCDIDASKSPNVTWVY